MTQANGYVRSEACVVMVLQRSTEAKRIYCKILNAKSNSDGYKVEGITFPSIIGQRTLVSEVYKEVGVDPSKINYIEAHVTGTAAGDPVEMNAMYDVICTRKTANNPLHIGCLKSNMGHTEGASGLCALAKACIIYQTKQIPPNLHFKAPNQNIRGLLDERMKPVNQITPFDGGYIPVNCFGFGGANVHVLTESFYPSIQYNTHRITTPIPRIIQVCGRTASSVNHILKKLTLNQSEYLEPGFLSILNSFAILPHTRGMKYRGYAIAIDQASRYNLITPCAPSKVRAKELSFIFPDAMETVNSSHDLNNHLRELKKVKIFADSFGRLEKILAIRYKVAGLNGTTTINYTGSQLKSHRFMQCVAAQISMVNVMFSLDIKVNNIIARGSGEIAAGYMDGVLSEEDAITCAYLASDLLGQVNSQQVLSKRLSEQIVLPKKFSRKMINANNDFATGAYLAEKILDNKNEPCVPCDSINYEVTLTSGISVHKRKDRPSIENQISSTVIPNLLSSIGQLYMNGSNCDISKLYPPVEYPLPSTTASLSALVRWNHEKTYPLAPFLVQSFSYYFQKSRDMAFHFDRRTPEDTFLFDHKIDGRVLFPATGYMMMAWIAFAKLNNICVYDMPVEFTDVSFERATVMSSAETHLSIRINEHNGGFMIKEGENVVARGYVKVHNVNYIEPKAQNLPDDTNMVRMESRDLYREFRIRGYDYGQFFQGLNDTRADGRSGNLIWREVLAKGFKESMSLETDEDQSLLWLRSWTTFSDAMFQLLLMSQQDFSRNLFVPRKLESLVCSPDLLRQNIAESPQYQDSITLSEASNITAYADPDENIVWVKGMVIKGLKTSLLKRRQQFVRHKKWYLAPNMEDKTLEKQEDIRRVKQYYDECVALATRLNNHEMGSWIETSVDIEDDSHSLLRTLVHRFKGASDFSDITLDKDLLIGTGDDDWYFPERLLKPHMERIVYDLVDADGMKVEVIEVSCSNDYFLTRAMQSFADESLLYDHTAFTFSLAHPEPHNLDGTLTTGLKNVTQFDFNSPTQLPPVELLVFRVPDSRSPHSVNVTQELFDTFYTSLRDDGFVLLVLKEPLSNPTIRQALSKISVKVHETISSEQVIDMAKKSGFQLISLKFLEKSLLPVATILLRKKDKKIASTNQHQLHLGLTNYAQWFPLLHEKLSSIKNDNDSRLWILPDVNEDLNDMKCATGILGFVKSLRLEPGYKNIRCLADFSCNDKRADIFDEKYGDMLALDMVYNIWVDDETKWAQYEHVSMTRALEEDDAMKKDMEHVYLRTMKPGDLTSFAWAQLDVSHVPSETLASVYYAPLNFRDIMFATGRLAPEAIPGIPANVAQDSILGLEFAGKDSNGNRVMGVVPYKAIATSVVMSDPDLVWPIPADWTMEEAATVPCVYATAYYALVIRGSLTDNETVLIHAGAGGVGMAAIRICLSRNCRVFTTVGSQAKRDYLLKEFPGLSDQDILYSRDTSFEDNIMRLTNGQGVDIVLNSLAEDQLRAGLRCLAPNGRFLEIGKVDFIQDSALYSQEMDLNRSFHGVLLDSLFKYSDDDYLPTRMLEEKKTLKNLVMEGIIKGTVKPLPRSVFKRDQVEDAFRFMSSGKHIGKVVLKIKDEQEEETTAITALKKSYFDINKSYIVVGGLGGFGLEVVNWLAEKGARKIVISARRGIREPYQAFCVNRLKARGVDLLIAHDVVYTKEGVESLLQKSNQLGPVGGIFNTAVVYDDILFDDMTSEQFDRVMQPKLIATLFLDELSRKMCPKLDYFVTFSSISCGRGNGGQTNYNFANSSMDHICEIRHCQGLPALSIQWGVVGDVGIVTEKTGGSTEVVLLGATSQRCHSLLDSMDRFLQCDHPVCLSYVKADKAGNSSGDSVDLLKMVSRIFGIKDISVLDPCATLGSLGIDSLIAVEMKQLLERVTGNSMSVKEIREITISTLIELSKNQAKADTK